jgi:hypothetical protein
MCYRIILIKKYKSSFLKFFFYDRIRKENKINKKNEK